MGFVAEEDANYAEGVMELDWPIVGFINLPRKGDGDQGARDGILKVVYCFIRFRPQVHLIRCQTNLAIEIHFLTLKFLGDLESRVYLLRCCCRYLLFVETNGLVMFI